MALDPLLDIKDLEQQKFVDDGSGNVAVRVNVVSDIEQATTISSKNLVLVSADTEYSHALPDNTKQIRVRARTAFDVRYAWETGKVATPIAPYSTLLTGLELAVDAVNFTSKTLYFATDEAGIVVEVEVLT